MECLLGAPPPRGQYVTFITHPSFCDEGEDAYELFSTLELEERNKEKNKGTKKEKKSEGTWRAETFFYLESGFTVAAVGDAGNTVLTLNLSELERKPRGFE